MFDAKIIIEDAKKLHAAITDGILQMQKEKTGNIAWLQSAAGGIQHGIEKLNLHQQVNNAAALKEPAPAANPKA